MQKTTTLSDRQISAGGWRKSSYSGDENGDCLEVLDGIDSLVPVRDSKNPNGPQVPFSAACWSSFVSAVKDGSMS